MSDPSNRQAALAGVGAYRPRRTVTNEEICELIDSTDEWIRTRSGIVSRGWAEADETLDAIASAAASEALGAAGLEAAALGLVLVATCTNGQPI